MSTYSQIEYKMARPFLPSSEKAAGQETPHDLLKKIAADDIRLHQAIGLYNPNGQILDEDDTQVSGVRIDKGFTDEVSRVVYEAKASQGDLTSAHAVSQFQSILRSLATETPKGITPRFRLVTFFALEAIAQATLGKAITALGDTLDLSGVDVNIITEIDNRVLEAPAGYNLGKDEPLRRDREVIGMRTYDVERGFLPIQELQYDPENIRILGLDEDSLSQDECERRLLADGDCTSDRRAIERRWQMLGGYIMKPLVCHRTEDGSVRVIDGNSRLALSKDIIRRTGNDGRNAPGYLHLPVVVFPQDITPEVLNAHKNMEQHAVKLDHGQMRDAFEIYRQLMDITDGDKPTNGDVARVARNLRTTKDKAKRAYEAISMLRNSYSMDGDDVARFYNVAYCLTGVKWSGLHKSWERHDVTLHGLMRFFIDGQTDPSISGWLTSGAIHKLENFLRAQTKPVRDDKGNSMLRKPEDWELRIVTNLLSCEPDWTRPQDWVASQKNEVNNHRSRSINRGYVLRQTGTALTALDRIEAKFRSDKARIDDAEKSGRTIKTERLFVQLDAEKLSELENDLQKLKVIADGLSNLVRDAKEIRYRSDRLMECPEDIYDGYDEDDED